MNELADRLNTSVAAVVAWEKTDPPFSVVERAVSATGSNFGVVVTEPEPDPHDLSLLDETLALTPAQRLERMMAYVRFIEAGRAAVERART